MCLNKSARVASTSSSSSSFGAINSRLGISPHRWGNRLCTAAVLHGGIDYQASVFDAVACGRVAS